MGTFGKKYGELIADELWTEVESTLPIIPDGGDVSELHIKNAITAILDVLIKHFNSEELKQIKEAHLDNALI